MLYKNVCGVIQSSMNFLYMDDSYGCIWWKGIIIDADNSDKPLID